MTQAQNVAELSSDVNSSGILQVAGGGTGAATLTANNVILGNGTSSVTFVAPGSSGNVLTSDGTTWASSAPVFPSGTVLLFYQAAAPTGWTQVTSQNNKALRVVSGTGGGTGGSVAFTTAFTSQGVAGTVSTSVNAFTPSGSVSTSTSINNTTAGGSVSVSLASGGSVSYYTLSTSEIPSHTHNVTAWEGVTDSGSQRLFYSRNSDLTYMPLTAEATGGGGSHNHAFTNPSYSGSFSGSAHNHTASSSSSFSGNSVTPTASSSFSGTAINLAVQYIDIIMCSKN